MANIQKTLRYVLITVVMLFVILFVVQITHKAMIDSIPSDDRDANSMFAGAWDLIGAQDGSTNKGLLAPAILIVVVMALVGLIIYSVSTFSSRKGYRGRKRF